MFAFSYFCTRKVAFAVGVFPFVGAKLAFLFEKTNFLQKIFLKKINSASIMEFTIAERTHFVVRFLAKKKGITQAQVGELIGYSNKSSFSAVLSGRKEMPKKFGAKLAALDPEINPAFLTGESDDMLLNADEQPAEVRVSSAVAQQKQIQQHEPVRPGSIIVPPELAQMFTDLSATIRSQQETIQMLLEEKRTSAKVG